MQRPKIKVEPKVLLRQKKESIEVLVKESQKVQLEVKALKETKKGLEKYIDDALVEATRKLQKQSDALVVNAKEVERFKSVLNEKTIELDKKIEEVDAKFEALDRKQKSLELRIIKARDERKEQTAEYENKASDIKRREIIVADGEKQTDENAKIVDSALKKLRDKELKIDAKISESENAANKVQSLIDDLKIKEEEFKKSQSSVLRLSSAVDKKEEELIKRDVEQDKRDASLDEKVKKIEKMREDAVVNKKQLQADILRNKEVTTELRNRETKLAKREKLFQTKIGGE